MFYWVVVVAFEGTLAYAKGEVHRFVLSCSLASCSAFRDLLIEYSAVVCGCESVYVYVYRGLRAVGGA